MATWNELNTEARALGTTFDIVRRKYLRQLADRTGRNTVLLYSGWLDRPKHPGTSISDVDKIGLMTVVGGLDPARGLDLVIHTPGGDTAATESIAHFLRAQFGTDIRAIVPQLAIYYQATGRPIVSSYGGLGFNFTSPRLLGVLFSTQKGLFFWCPLLLLA
jgi:ClpP class serine protease